MPLESDTRDYKRLVMLPETAYAPCDDSRTIPVRSIKLVWEVATAHAHNNTRVARVLNRKRPLELMSNNSTSDSGAIYS